MSRIKDTADVTASVVMNFDWNQSRRSPRSSIHCSDPTATASSRMPPTSTVLARTWNLVSRTYPKTKKAARIPNGTLI